MIGRPATREVYARASMKGWLPVSPFFTVNVGWEQRL